MRRLTQTSLYPNGNCFQTAVACVLDVDLDAVPAQAKHDHKWTDAAGETHYGPHFQNSLGLYLRKHHGLIYFEADMTTAMYAFAPRGVHFLSGKTVRSGAQGGCTHIVVAEHGEMIWDPHPSRAGLVGPVKFSALVPFPPEYEEHWDRNPRPCVCPRCEPDKLKKCGCSECAPLGVEVP